jgi:CheY-like chemotaxis protein
MISTMLAARLWIIAADPSEVESAILNLAINARDAMPNGGTLTIETSNVEVVEPVAAAERYEEVSPGAYVRLSISDTGVGMRPDVLKRAFEPFFTTKEPGRGTGLGLATIYGFAKQSNGHLTIYSEVGRGTTVSLYLPRVDAESADPIETFAPPAPMSGAGKTILVVEDNPGVREVALERLARLGYRVLASSSGPAAIALINEGAALDLVFSDIVMPEGMSGIELAKWLAANRPDLPILLTSGFAEGAGSPPLPEPVKFLRKPYSTLELAKAIQEVLSHRPV